MIIPIKLRFKADKDSKSAFRTDKTIKSHDVNSVEFHITIDGLELTDDHTAKILSVFHSSKRQVNVGCEIVEGKIIYKPDTNLISRHEHVTNYVYVYHNNRSLDVREFIYTVDLSKIDETSLEVKEVYDQSYADLLTDFEQALSDYKLTLPQADSVRAEIDVILNQFGVDSQAKLSQYDADAQQVIADNQTAFGLAETGRQDSYEQAESERNQSSAQSVIDWTQEADALLETVEGNESARVVDEASRVEKESERVQAETERIQAEQARKEAETLREESYEQKVDTALVEADIVEKVDNKVTELTPRMNELTAQLAQKANVSYVDEQIVESQKLILDYPYSLAHLNQNTNADTTRNYIILDETDVNNYGYVVYHNGDQWVTGWRYQSTGISDKDKNLIFEANHNHLHSQIIEEFVKMRLSFETGFIASANHARGAGYVDRTSPAYERTLPTRFKQGDRLIIDASASSSVLLLSKWSATGSFLNGLIVGEGNTVKKTYEYTVQDEYEYLAIANNRDIGSKTAGITLISNNAAKFNRVIQSVTSNFNSVKTPQSIRKPVISFIFDDGNATDTTIANIFRVNNLRCGFALMSNISNVNTYLNLQDEGFEILNHSTSGLGFNDELADPVEVENRIRMSKEKLENKGFNVVGWVTPSSQMHESFLPILNKYHEYAYTDFLGVWSPANQATPYNTFLDDTRQLKRVSLETTTVENSMLAIDETIANNGMLTFYAHNFSRGLSETDLVDIVSYAKNKVIHEQCLVVTPKEAYNHFYTLRHSDLINLFT